MSTIVMSSNRPYLLRAMYEWIADNGMTPYILVDAAAPDDPWKARFDRLHRRSVVRHRDGECASFQSRASGPANAMDVIISGLGYVKVDNVRYFRNIKPAGNDVGRYQHAVFAILEPLKGVESLVLGFIGMDYPNFVFKLSLDTFVKFIGQLFVFDKNEHFGKFFFFGNQ